MKIWETLLIAFFVGFYLFMLGLSTSLCPMEKCEHYHDATKYPRKCYYEALCWRGWFDIIRSMIVQGEER